jgi:hypothetical protein
MQETLKKSRAVHTNENFKFHMLRLYFVNKKIVLDNP